MNSLILQSYIIGFFFPLVSLLIFMKYVRITIIKYFSPSNHRTFAINDSLKLDHTKAEYYAYFLGVATPYLLAMAVFIFPEIVFKSAFVDIVNNYLISNINLIETIYFLWYITSIFFILLSLGIPIGDAVFLKYNQKRICIGIPSIRKLLKVNNAIAFPSIVEMFSMFIITIFGAGITTYLIFISNPTISISIFEEIERNIILSDSYNHCNGFLYFIYFSIITILSLSPEGITPITAKPIIVLIGEIIAGITFFTGIFPPLIGILVKRKINKKINFDILNDMSQPLQKSVNWLHSKKSSDGSWSGLNNSEYSIPCIAMALKSNGFTKEAYELQNIYANNLTNELSKRLWEIFHLVSIEKPDIDTACQLYKNIDQQSATLIKLFLISNDILKSDILLESDINESDWRKEFGPHWGTYGLVADYLKYPSNYQSYVNHLITIRNKNGSYYGDVILSSLITCSLFISEEGPIAGRISKDTTNWLLKLKSINHFRLCDSLNIWDTAWSTYIFHMLDTEYHDLQDSIEWLKKSFSKEPINGWSWSTEGKILCLDTTTLIYDCFLNNNLNDNLLDSINKISLKTIINTIPKKENDLFPTFRDDDGIYNPCPIISSRVSSILTNIGITNTIDPNKIIECVLNGESSEWFTDKSITKGFVLYYISKTLTKPSEPLESLFKNLIDDINNKNFASPEGKLATLLGCSKFITKYRLILSDRDKYSKLIIQHYYDILYLQNTDGSWTSTNIGTFGFGMLYSDIIFSSCLGILSLIEYNTFINDS